MGYASQPMGLSSMANVDGFTPVNILKYMAGPKYWLDVRPATYPSRAMALAHLSPNTLLPQWEMECLPIDGGKGDAVVDTAT